MATDHHHAGSHGDDGGVPLNHEPRDISLDSIGKFTIASVLVVTMSSVLMYGTFRLLDRRARAADTPAVTATAERPAQAGAVAPLMDGLNAMDKQGRAAAGPRMLTNEPAWLREVRATTTTAQATYGWVDKDAGVVRLPIARAKQLLLERGLPDTTPPPEPAAAAQ